MQQQALALEKKQSQLMRVLVLRAPGINCDVETQHAFELAGAQARRVHVTELLEGRDGIRNYDIVAIPGGFCYGDYVSSGKILANKIKFKLRGGFEEFIAGGKIVVGICNGFQVLVKSGMLPGGPDGEAFSGQPTCTLFQNKVGRFQDRWVRIRNSSTRPALAGVGEIFCPVNHGEGQFIPASAEILAGLYADGQVIFRYVDENGEVAKDFPDNPNGAVDSIAGICNKGGNVLGLMPHPEKFLYPQLHPSWSGQAEIPKPGGRDFFNSIVQYASKSEKSEVR